MGRQDFETETLLAIGGFPSSDGDLYKCQSCSFCETRTVHETTCPICGPEQMENVMVKPTIGPLVGSEFDFSEQQYVTHPLRGEGFDASEDGTGRGTPLIPVAAHTTGAGFWRQGLGTLRGREQDSHENIIAFTSKDHGADASEISPTLRSMGHDGSHANGGGQVAVAFQESQSGTRLVDSHATLGANDGPRRMNGVISGMAVRRLTPRECERLQGFPDDYTKISDRAADGPRYKALGNSMAVPCMVWLGRRIQMVENLYGENNAEQTSHGFQPLLMEAHQ